MRISKLLLAATATLALSASAALAQETLRIGTEGAYPPFNNLTADGQLVGFDIDIANALCEEMKVKCEFVTQDWDGIIPALQAGKFDAIVASMTITDERKKQVLFTRKYYATPLSLVALKGSGVGTTDPAQLVGKTVGAQAATVQAQYAEEHYAPAGADIKQYPNYEDAVADLNNGRLDVVISDKLFLMQWLDSAGKDCCELVGDIPGTETEAGIAVGLREEALRDRFDTALEEIRADGTYEAIRSRYFKFDIY